MQTGTQEDWESLQDKLQMRLPDELFLISSHYGGGVFVEGEFSIGVHSAFRPRYDLLVEWNRRIFSKLAVTEPDPYDSMFEIGGYGFGDDQGSMRRIYWDTRGEPNSWKIGLTTCDELQDKPLSVFLRQLFTNELHINGFPDRFGNVRFEAATWGKEDET